MDTAQEVRGRGIRGGGQMLQRSHEKSLTRMKSPWLANFWCSWMVENTDRTKQLNTSRKLKGRHQTLNS